MNSGALTTEREIQQAFNALRDCCGSPDALDYFFRLAEEYFHTDRKFAGQEALIVGNSFPEALLRANGVRPHWVIGGSLAMGEGIDALVPRDADAVSRSVFGYINAYLSPDDHETPVLVPMTGDNQKKLAYLLQSQGRNVSALDIVPEAQTARRYAALASQLDGCMDDLFWRWSLPGSGERLRLAMREIREAKTCLHDVLEDPGIPMSGTLKLFLANTYYYAPDLTRWRESVTALSAQIKRGNAGADERPQVLIVGSPVLFPNYKVPILLERAGLSIGGVCDIVSSQAMFPPDRSIGGGKKSLLYGLVRDTYSHDSAGSFVENGALRCLAEKILAEKPVQGVIYHVIKGQIEYDFELEAMERLFARYRLPVFRLETDYHDNDEEQLRIRLEAFAELLYQGRQTA